MPAQINANYSANFQKFVDFADNAYATKGAKGGDTVLRFTGAPSGDYKGSFASFRRAVIQALSFKRLSVFEHWTVISPL